MADLRTDKNHLEGEGEIREGHCVFIMDKRVESSAICPQQVIQSSEITLNHRVNLQRQRSISCVQQEFSSPVNTNHSHGLLIQAHLEDDKMAADTAV